MDQNNSNPDIMQYRFLIAEDHPLVAHCLEEILVGNYPSPKIDQVISIEELFDHIKKDEYDLLILDMMLTDGISLSSLQFLKQIKPALKILVISSLEEATYAQRALHLGADGYINKQAQSNEIARAIQWVLADRIYMSPHMQYTLSLDKINRQPKTANPFDLLTIREFEVAMMLANGDPVHKIAEVLNLGRSTVSTHKIKIFEKLKVDNIIELNKLAITYNIKQK